MTFKGKVTNSGTDLDGEIFNFTPETAEPEFLATGNTGVNQKVENRSPFLAINFQVALQGVFPSRNRRLSEGVLAEIIMFAGNFAIRGWAECNGQIIPINQNQSLFSLLKTTYGGDGRTSFALPDFRGRTPVHEGSDSSGSPDIALGHKGGRESFVLTSNEIPAHLHQVQRSKQSSFQANVTIVSGDTTLDNTRPTLESVLPLPDIATTSTSGGQSVNIQMPYLGVNMVIALQGIYPTRGRRLDQVQEEVDERELAMAGDACIAQVSMFAGNFNPRGWAFTNGQTLPISQNTALFSLLGTTFGGDGRTTVGLPNLKGRSPLHPGRGPGLSDRRLGQKGGDTEVTLSIAQLPAHARTHIVEFGGIDPSQHDSHGSCVKRERWANPQVQVASRNLFPNTCPN